MRIPSIKRFTPALLCCIVFILALPVGCGKQATNEERRKGKIKAIDPQARTLLISEKSAGATTNDIVEVRRTYHVSDDCRITTAEKAKAEFGDLKVGDRINYRFAAEGGKSVIHKITPRGADSGTDEQGTAK